MRRSTRVNCSRLRSARLKHLTSVRSCGFAVSKTGMSSASLGAKLSDLVAAESQKQPEPVIAVLVHTGTAINGTFPGGGLAAVGVTAFGRRLLQELEDVETSADS